MSKRPSSTSEGLPPSKRRQTDNESIELIVSHSDELIKCLQALSKSPKETSPQGDMLQNLRSLSKKLLPSFKYLAGEEEYTPENEKIESKEKTIHSHSLDGPPIPSLSAIRPWTASDIPATLPPLPKINNPVLEVAAFTHQGKVKNKGDLSYDRLEWLGDAYVELLSTCLIFQTFGGLPTGKCSQIREVLIKNANLGDYSTQYKLFERAILPAELDPNSKIAVKASPQEVKKVRGDLFEAYVAAVILSDADGLRRAGEWLRSLWSMTIKDKIQSADKTPDIHVVKELGSSAAPQESRLPPKVELSNVVGAKGINIRYEDLPSANKKDKLNKKLALFTVGVYLDGWGERNKLLGVGSDLNKKEAGQKAAAAALSNKKLMKTYQDKKAALYKARGDLDGMES
ncbi:RNase3 domain-containing protein [Colletotrichum camelliae]|nr:RNase3 domain-containing protein [Colletotrichum camelliae]